MFFSNLLKLSGTRDELVSKLSDQINNIKSLNSDLEKQLIEELKNSYLKNKAHTIQFELAQYIRLRRKLNLINMLPPELGLYSEALENAVKAKLLKVGRLKTDSVKDIEAEYYTILETKCPKNDLADIKLTNNMLANIGHILTTSETVIEISNKWVDYVYKKIFVGLPHYDFIVKWYRKTFRKDAWNLEVATYVKYLARIMKESDQFYEIVKKPIKRACKRYREIIGEVPGIVITDVVPNNVDIFDFMSSIWLLENYHPKDNLLITKIKNTLSHNKEDIRKREDEITRLERIEE